MKSILAIKNFLFEKFYGAIVWIAFCAILDGLWCWADAYLPDESWGMNLVRNVFWFSAVAVVAGAAGYSLWTKRVGRAVGQLLLSLVTFGVASVLLAVVNVFTFEVALEHRGPDKGWWSVGPNEQVPFAVEYRSLHPFWRSMSGASRFVLGAMSIWTLIREARGRLPCLNSLPLCFISLMDWNMILFGANTVLMSKTKRLLAR